MSMTPAEEAQRQWAVLGARAAMDGVTPEEIPSWLSQQPEILQLSEQTEEDSSPAPQLSNAERAAKLADEILHTPTTTSQAIELAKVYALLAIHDRMPVSRTATTKKATS